MTRINLKFILESFKPYRIWIYGQLLVAFIIAVDVSFRPYLVKVMLDKLFTIEGQGVLSAIQGPIILYLVVSLFMVLIMRVYDYCWLKFNPPLKCHLGSVLMERMMKHSVNLTNNHFAGALANRIKDAMSGIPDILKFGSDRFLSQGLAIIVAIVVVGFTNLKFSLALAIWVTLFLTVAYLASSKISLLSNRAASVRSTVVGKMVDILTNLNSVRLFSSRQEEQKYLKTSLDDYIKADQSRDWFFLKLFLFQGLSFVIYQGITFYWLMDGFKQGIVTPGDFALILSINISIVDRLWGLSKDIGAFADLLGNITQGLSIVLSEIEIADKDHAQEMIPPKGAIEFKNVHFFYKGSAPLFTNLSLKIQPGEKVGFVGYSGSGKTSLVNLLLRFYEINDGEILIDGQNINAFTQDSLRRQMSFIPQEPSLFHRSILENIRYGNPKATPQDVKEAAQKAWAHEFITQLSEGYDSMVGERGVKLSGGQRQRISIARAILKDSPILVLDEATSQLDSVTENAIQDSLHNIMESKTTIIIAHRLSTLLKVDRIVVFDRGRIVQDGTHKDLITQKGLYKTLWENQVGDLIVENRVSA